MTLAASSKTACQLHATWSTVCPPACVRLPKASHAFDHLWTTEWPRIREIESERFLLDMHGA